MLPYLIAGAIGYAVAKLFEEDETPKYADGGLIAPNGKPSNLTYSQYKLVRTKAFKDWFGDWENSPETASKVVDENGEPLPVYHGSYFVGNVFKVKYNNDGIGLIYFSDKKDVAEKYGNGREFFLYIENLDEIDIEGRGFNDAYDNTSLESELRYVEDGIVVRNIFDDPSGKKKGKISNVYAVKYPEQIKLADGTNTTFDGNNPDIRFDGGGKIDEKVGKEFWFEYHCLESPTSCDAEIWYRSHQKVKVLKVVHWSYDDKNERLKDGNPRVYLVEWQDGFQYDVTEDELMQSPYEFYRPDPPKRMKKGGRTIAQTPAFKEWFGDWENRFSNGGNVNDAFLQIKSLIDKSEITDKFNYEYSIQYHSLYEELIKVSSELGEWDSPKLTKKVENIIKDKFYKELKTRINLVDGKIQLFRAILIKDINTIDIENLGVYWAYSYDFAQVFNDMGYKHNEKDISKYYEYIIKADFNLIDIDWSATLDYYIMSEFGEGEIRLKKDVPAYNLKIQKRGENEWRNINGKIFKAKKGGRTIAQTPAPKKERIYGSEKNKPESSKDTKSAEKIEFNEKTLETIKNKVAEHNEKNPNKKVTLASAKAVVRRGMGAYSSSHRPTIKGGKQNSRVAWGLARLNAFFYKIINGKSKSGKYSQDDDLINELGYKVAKYVDGGQVEKMKNLFLQNGFTEDELQVIVEENPNYFNRIEFYDNETLIVYRTIALPRRLVNKFIQLDKKQIGDGIGEYWTLDKEFARSVWGRFHYEEEETFDVMCIGHLKIKDIDWQMMKYAYKDEYWHFTSESEIRGVNGGNSIKVVECVEIYLGSGELKHFN